LRYRLHLEAVKAMVDAVKQHWPEYLIEGAALGAFLFSACMFPVLLEHPASPIHQAIDDVVLRRALMGLAMGATAISIIYSPWGKRSGAHMNPSVTLAFYTTGRVAGWDAALYIVSQTIGAVLGVALARLLIGEPVEHSAVGYAATRPGMDGIAVAFAAEFAISALLMTAVLVVSNTPLLSRFTGLVAGCMVALYITFEAPLSGMSMNPARTFGSAYGANDWTAWWVYLIAPPVAMVAAAQLYRLRYGAARVFCAKLHHHNSQRCIFRCNYGKLHAE
jgi:aquaporin Z